MAVAIAVPAAAQTREPDLPPHLTLDYWDDLDGLPQNTVAAIAQGEEGYLWLGTQEGLARFDGARFVPMPLDSSGSSRFVDAIIANPDTSLWVASGELLLFKNGRAYAYDTIPGWPTRRVWSLFRDSQGRLWVGSGGGDVAVVTVGERVRVVSVESPFSAAVRSFAEDSEGRIWIGANDGLAILDGNLEAGARRVPHAPPAPILALGLDARGTMWLGSAAGLFRATGDGFVRIQETGGAAVGALMPPRDDHTGWVTVGSRLFRLTLDGRAEALPNRLQLGNLAHAIIEDREGSLWLGTAGSGLARLRNTVAISLGKADGVSAHNVSALLVDRTGTAWIGTMGAGLNRFRGVDVDSLSVESGHLASNVVLSLEESRDSSIWVGTSAGLSRIRNGSARIYTVEDGLLNQRIRVVKEDRAGRLWLAGDVGLQEFRPDGTGRTVTTADGLRSNYIISLYEDLDGVLWLGTSEGIAAFDGERVTAWSEAGGSRIGWVMGMTRHSGGSFWLATLTGILRKDGDRFQRYSLDDGLCTDQAYTLVEDQQGRLWVSSNHGLYWLTSQDFADYDAGRTERLPCRLIDRAAGMPSREANGGVNPAGIHTATGLLWFPTVRGVAIVDPEALSLDLPAPAPVVEELVADGAPLDLARGRIAADASHVSFRFTGLSFIASDRLRFRYRLEGYDREWRDARGERTADYTNLPPGHYRFQVTAANVEGEWSPDPAELPIVVEANFWETGWFIAGTAGLLVLLGLGLHRWRMDRLDRRRQQVFQLEQAAARAETLAVDARLRALRLELHPHFFFNTLNGISGLIRDGDQRSALDLLSRFADLTRATLQARDARTRPLDEELDYIRQYLDLERIRFGDRLRIDIRTAGSIEELEVPPLLLQPIVENAVRHGVAKVGRDARLDVEACALDGMLRLRVRDNGPGFDRPFEDLPRGTGLRNVQQRLHEIYGADAVLRMVPQERGTLIEIVIPVRKNGRPASRDTSS